MSDASSPNQPSSVPTGDGVKFNRGGVPVGVDARQSLYSGPGSPGKAGEWAVDVPGVGG